MNIYKHAFNSKVLDIHSTSLFSIHKSHEYHVIFQFLHLPAALITNKSYRNKNAVFTNELFLILHAQTKHRIDLFLFLLYLHKW